MRTAIATPKILIVDNDQQLSEMLCSITATRPDLSFSIDLTDPLIFMHTLTPNVYNLVALNITSPHAFDLLRVTARLGIPVCLIIDSSPEALIVARFIQYDFLIKPFITETVIRLIEKNRPFPYHQNLTY